jgi:hypothetical protein
MATWFVLTLLVLGAIGADAPLASAIQGGNRAAALEAPTSTLLSPMGRRPFTGRRIAMTSTSWTGF